jgi:hypothetical protein
MMRTRCARFPMAGLGLRCPVLGVGPLAGLGLRCSVFGPRRRDHIKYQGIRLWVPGT